MKGFQDSASRRSAGLERFGRSATPKGEGSAPRLDRWRQALTALTNGNYVASASSWDNGPDADVGAATWANGSTGLVGEISTGNALIGSQPSDSVSGSVVALENGNYVLCSSAFNGAGAIAGGATTWGDGSVGTTGVVSAANSLVGTSNFDLVGISGVIALANGNYVVASSSWNGVAELTGAVTWQSGFGPSSDVVSDTNSLVGNIAFDQVSDLETVAFSDSNYVVAASIGTTATMSIPARSRSDSARANSPVH
jgi:hypothetical protein